MCAPFRKSLANVTPIRTQLADRAFWWHWFQRDTLYHSVLAMLGFPVETRVSLCLTQGDLGFNQEALA